MKYPDDFINKIICGDCLEVMKEIPDGSIDLVLTSPPFLDKEVVGDYYTFLDKFISESRRLSKILLMFNSSRRLVSICKRYSDIQHVLVWNKKFTLPAFKYEPIFVITEEKIWGPGRIYRDVLSYSGVRKKNKLHINENPVELYSELLRFFPKAEVVLDPFIGSGTTAIACKIKKRKFIGIDSSRECCEIVEKRLQEESIVSQTK